MSIWCSNSVIGHDPHDDEPVEQVQVRSYANGWSNHYPTTDGTVERDASIDTSFIPAWCAGGEDDDYESVGPWLRLGVKSWRHDWREPTELVGPETADVVMDESAVRTLVDQLNEWLARPKVAPEAPSAWSPTSTARTGASGSQSEPASSS